MLFQELQQLKTDLEQVLALTQDLINAQLGASAGSARRMSVRCINGKYGKVLLQMKHLFSSAASSASGVKEEEVEEAAAERPKKKKSRWTEDPIIPVKPWQVLYL